MYIDNIIFKNANEYKKSSESLYIKSEVFPAERKETRGKKIPSFL